MENNLNEPCAFLKFTHTEMKLMLEAIKSLQASKHMRAALQIKSEVGYTAIISDLEALTDSEVKILKALAPNK